MTSHEIDTNYAHLMVRTDLEAQRHLARAVFWAVQELEDIKCHPHLLNVWDRLKTALKRVVLEHEPDASTN